MATPVVIRGELKEYYYDEDYFASVNMDANDKKAMRVRINTLSEYNYGRFPSALKGFKSKKVKITIEEDV